MSFAACGEVRDMKFATTRKQRYIKAPVPPQRRSLVLRHLLPKRVQRPILQQLRPVLAQMKMYRRAGQRVLNIVCEAEAIQQIRLLPRLQLVQRRIKLPQGLRFDEGLFWR